MQILSLKMEWSGSSIFGWSNWEIFWETTNIIEARKCLSDKTDNITDWRYQTHWQAMIRQKIYSCKTDIPNDQPTDQLNDRPRPFIYHDVFRRMVHHIVWFRCVHQSCRILWCQRNRFCRAMVPQQQLSSLFCLQLRIRLQPHNPLQVAGKHRW